MILIKRSVDINKDVAWVAHDLDKEKRRCTQLYVGTDVNGAIKAAIAAGMSQQDAVFLAQSEIKRSQAAIVDDIGTEYISDLPVPAIKG